jgi:hypothetical protein
MRSQLLLVAVLAGRKIQAQPSAAETPYRVGGGVSSLHIISSVDPEYTQEALDARREGDVLMELVVTRDGRLSHLHEIGQQLGFGLDQKAIRRRSAMALQAW